MKTQCSEEQLEFHALGKRAVVGNFDGGQISSDGGAPLPRCFDRSTKNYKGYRYAVNLSEIQAAGFF